MQSSAWVFISDTCTDIDWNGVIWMCWNSLNIGKEDRCGFDPQRLLNNMLHLRFQGSTFQEEEEGYVRDSCSPLSDESSKKCAKPPRTGGRTGETVQMKSSHTR